MKTVQPGDERVLGIAGKMRVNQKAVYRLSDFTILYSHNGKHMLHQTMTGQINRLTDEEYRWLRVAMEKYAIGEAVLATGLEALIKQCFMVERDADDANEYLNTVKIMKLLHPEKPGIKTYTILPTTTCNARCFYCYEQGIHYVTMDQEMADRVVDFICRTKCEERITLSWFGGEPLVASHIIRRICDSLAAKNVKYQSRMISNASLFTPELAHEAKEKWNLKRIQVSLDGHRCDYATRKNYNDPKRYNYDTVMRAIHYLLNEEIEVYLRCNYDAGNISRFEEFFEDLHREFGINKHLHVYSRLLYQERDCPKGLNAFTHELQLRDIMTRFHLCTSIDAKKQKLQTNFCMADSQGRSVVINADGTLWRCEHLVGNCGNIFDIDITNYHHIFKIEWELDDICRHCAFLPRCTPFYKTGCPDWFKNCREFFRLEEVYTLSRISENEETNNHGLETYEVAMQPVQC